jgi:hypothetical protein
MTGIPTYPPVAAVAVSDRPLWSVMIPTYNCAKYLRTTLETVLAQDPGPAVMQIEVVDDCSFSDDPESVTKEVGGGRVGFFRQRQNVGHTANFNTCLNRSMGQLVHLLHGDDAIRPGFYDTFERLFEENPTIGFAFSRYLGVDENGQWRSVSRLAQDASGILPDALRVIASRQPVQTAATVVRRAVYEDVGGFAPSLDHCGEDWEMWMRIAARYPVWYEAEPLAVYRVHAGSLTGNAVRTAANTKELGDVIALARAYFPEEHRDELTAAAGACSAAWALELAGDLLEHGDRAGARRQLMQALRLSRSPRIVGRASYLSACLLANYVGLTTARP